MLREWGEEWKKTEFIKSEDGKREFIESKNGIKENLEWKFVSLHVVERQIRVPHSHMRIHFD